MITDIKQVCFNRIRDIWMNRDEIDIVKEAADLFMDITLRTLFGQIENPPKVKQIVIGRIEWWNLGEALQRIF